MTNSTSQSHLHRVSITITISHPYPPNPNVPSPSQPNTHSPAPKQALKLQTQPADICPPPSHPNNHMKYSNDNKLWKTPYSTHNIAFGSMDLAKYPMVPWWLEEQAYYLCRGFQFDVVHCFSCSILASTGKWGLC